MLTKYVSVQSSLNHPEKELSGIVKKRIAYAQKKGYERLFESHRKEWERIWAASDVIIEGDISAQQGIRFNIFHLNQTYTGRDERLNIGPKGFTGEKYGGSYLLGYRSICTSLLSENCPWKSGEEPADLQIPASSEKY